MAQSTWVTMPGPISMARPGRPLSQFLRKYVREPLQTLLAAVPAELPELVLRMDRSEFTASLAGEALRVQRNPPDSGEAETDAH